MGTSRGDGALNASTIVHSSLFLAPALQTGDRYVRGRMEHRAVPKSLNTH